MPATGSVLVDTSVAIAYLRHDPVLQRKLDEIDDIFLPVIALGELYYGARKAKHVERAIGSVVEFAEGCILIPITTESAGEYGRIKSELMAAGTAIPENDIWIAAVASERRLPIAVRDSHFSRIRGLTVLDW